MYVYKYLFKNFVIYTFFHSPAILISGLKQKGIKYSPYSIKRAITNTATKLGYVDPFAQGSGLLNVEKSFEHLTQHAEAPENMLRYEHLNFY